MYRNEKNREYHTNYRKRNRKSIQNKNLEYKLKYPWINSFYNAKQRCENPNNPNYSDYGKKGIKFLLTKEECEYFWNRDKGWLLNQHSIDRIDNNGHYKLSNCQFIEMG